MTDDRIRRPGPPVSSDPGKPAYDNPVGDKGDLAAGTNARQRKWPPPSPEPQGHPSDKVLGRKPADADATE